ncbi:alpha/beta fold hydrolase [Candidatus Sumerlaeota bacterium]|nr:alpha/beta fold hydrolase [Candidatus Sumerlaeota bacterium]
MTPDLPNIPTPTLGGGPLWEDVAQVEGYRIQRNRMTGHHRLIDAANVRRAWGSHETCEEMLARLIGEPEPAPHPNIPLPTLGGMQFWADEIVHCGWRIQRNVFTGHHRLLDPRDRRQAWGTLEQCDVVMRRLHEEAEIEPQSDRVVILVHGILSWRGVWGSMIEALRRGGYEPVAINYPSTRAGIEDHVEQLARVIANLADHEELHFVTHSMGGLIVRRLLADFPEISEETGRVVMIATPNNGAVTADLVRDLFAFHLVFGPAGRQLVTGINSFVHGLPVPDCEFAVIAGSGGKSRGINPLLSGDNDGVVEAESARLEGMSDFLLVPHGHNTIMRATEVVEATVRFLRTGRLTPSPSSA